MGVSAITAFNRTPFGPLLNRAASAGVRAVEDDEQCELLVRRESMLGARRDEEGHPLRERSRRRPRPPGRRSPRGRRTPRPRHAAAGDPAPGRRARRRRSRARVSCGRPRTRLRARAAHVALHRRRTDGRRHLPQTKCMSCNARPVQIDLDALFQPGRARPSGWRRMPAVAGDAMVATSHPLATRAGLRALERGGNAVDAALAAAAILTVAEPTDNGIGGDAFALVWDDGALYGLNGSGRSPAELGDRAATDDGPCSVTVPGAVRLWDDLATRFGRFGLDRAIGPAADLAETGVACTARIAHKWSQARLAPWRAPGLGERYSLPELASHAPSDRDERPCGPLRGRGRGGDRDGDLALGGRPPGSSLGVGRASASGLPRNRRLRAAAERPGSRGAAGARPLRRSRAGRALGDRGDEARARRHARRRARRPVAVGLLRRGAARCASCARPSGRRRSPASSTCRVEGRRTCVRWTETGWPSR